MFVNLICQIINQPQFPQHFSKDAKSTKKRKADNVALTTLIKNIFIKNMLSFNDIAKIRYNLSK